MFGAMMLAQLLVITPSAPPLSPTEAVKVLLGSRSDQHANTGLAYLSAVREWQIAEREARIEDRKFQAAMLRLRLVRRGTPIKITDPSCAWSLARA